ncbi:hypothetical protein MTO96_042362 [Rhipicephalus appendiculatus]
MASASSQLNVAMTHNRFAALAMEDMELGADESNNTTAPSRTTEVLNNAGRTAVAVQGSDLNPRDTAGWKFTATKQVSQIQLQPQASKDTQNKSTSQFSESQAKKIIARVTKSSRLPVNLPKEEQKIIMRPRGGLCLARLEVDVILSAVITAASVTKTEAMEDTICTNPTQNIIVVSTPDEERANKYATVRSLFIGGKNYETYAYRTAPHGTAKGVIRGIALDATDEEIQNDIVHPANPTALEAHRIGSTASVVILFQGTKVPRSVKYGPCRVPCGLYKQHYDHPITPGNASHVASYAAERMPRERRAAHANIRCPLSSPSADGRKRTMKDQHYHKRTSRTCPHLREDNGNNNKKSKAKGLEFREGGTFRRKEIKAEAAPRGRGTTTQEKMNFNQGRQPPARQLNQAQATRHQEMAHTNSAQDQINRALRQENEQLKRSLAELNARLNSFINAQNSQAPKQREHSSQQPKVQEAAPQPLAPNPPVPEKEKDNIEMEEQPCAENNTEPETGEADRSCGPAPKRRALEGSPRKANQHETGQTRGKAKPTGGENRPHGPGGRSTRAQKVDTFERKVDALDRKIDMIIQALVAAGIIPQPALNLTTHNG